MNKNLYDRDWAIDEPTIDVPNPVKVTEEDQSGGFNYFWRILKAVVSSICTINSPKGFMRGDAMVVE